MCLGIPGRVIEIRDDAGLPMGKVDFGGVRKEVCLAYLPEVELGDYVIIHVGFAISRVDEDEARKTLEILATMGDLVRSELATMGPGMDEPAVISDDGTPVGGPFAGPAASAVTAGSNVPASSAEPGAARGAPARPADSGTAPGAPA